MEHRTNTENAKRRIAMRNRRRWKKVMEDIGILRDVLREVCERLIRIEKKDQREEKEDKKPFLCMEESEEERGDEVQGEEGQEDKESEQEGPVPVTDNEDTTEEEHQAEGQDESTEEMQISDSERDEEEKDLLPKYPFSRKNPGPYAKEFIREVMKNVMERLRERGEKLAERTERLKDPDYFRRTSGLIDF
eukprot:TRINITY_DN3886_c0_g2_i8.p1 TRINITY_DN3886_c0_g2~~TRINITY_DN3886_c0_g2_i8.p1  ORF type:complete len:191 (-),score=56.43 TRINITY_DN3886_c0_g2_i8:14-586(-)